MAVDVAGSHTVTIRPAVPSDLDWLITQVKAFATFNRTKYFQFPTDEKARRQLQAMMEQHFMRIAERDGERLGFISAYWIYHPYNDEIPMLAETFWWVDPAYRHSSAGLRLLDAFIDFAVEKRIKWLTFSLLSKSPVNERCLTSRGFVQHERAFLLELD